jgi:hypothetical protein
VSYIWARYAHSNSVSCGLYKCRSGELFLDGFLDDVLNPDGFLGAVLVIKCRELDNDQV